MKKRIFSNHLFRVLMIAALVIPLALGAISSPAKASYNSTTVAWGCGFPFTGGQCTVPAGMSGVTALAGGVSHSLAVKMDGTVVGWGSNSLGQLNIPPGLSSVVAVDAGQYHSLALRSDSTVVAWGYNAQGQATVPVGLTGVTAVSAGDAHSLALMSDGTVVGWGENTYGQLNVPAGLTGVTAVSAGGRHSLALKSDGTIVAWGNNTYGQATVPAGLSSVVAIAAGQTHNLALKSDGTVIAWGNNDHGQVSVPAGLSGVAAVAAGIWHSLALKIDGTIVAWGDNTYGQLNIPAGLTGVTVITSGGHHGLALGRLNHAPLGVHDAYSADEDNVLTIAAPGVLSNDTDADLDPLSAVLVSSPAHGTLALNADGAFTYTPAADYSGSDSFTYKANDGLQDSNVAMVSITVNAVNDAPVAVDDAHSTNEDAALTIAAPGVLSNDTDADSNSLTAVLVSSPAYGTLALNADGAFTYTPGAGYSGSDSFTYKANDGAVDSNIAAVMISVDPVNDAPVAQEQSVATDEDTALGITLIATDADNDPLTYTIVALPTHGALSGTVPGLTYTPDAGYSGPDSFTYKANDGAVDSSVATVSITVNAVNDAPLGVHDAYSADEDNVLTIAAPGVLSNDTDADSNSLTAVLFSGPAHGTLALNADGAFTYTPAADYSGSDSFTYKANDGLQDSNVAMVSITVNAVNDAPVAVNDAYSTNEDNVLTIAAPGVFSNDTDADLDPLSAVLVSSPAYGTLALNADGSFTYTPAANYAGTDNFTYKANDGELVSDVATVSITVSQTNTAPTANPGGPYLGAINTAISFDGSASSDPDGDSLTFTWTFGDGSAAGTGATPTHSYTGTGVYDVCLTVNDDTVNSAPACTLAVVYDPSAGFVTGSGSINSPAGAYKPDESLTGQATFGFVSKYKKGAAVPTGTTQFQFSVAGFSFYSETYEWLVVNQGGTNAQFKGSGLINGAADPNGNAYKFMLWATDGKNTNSADTFRIRIWSEDAAGEHDVYDNGNEQAIGAGNIVVHTGK